ncbi:NAD(P)-dependent oxidoreductase [Niabella drilacis]|uniref:D-3-phosphoglycerate dehydrogenase n=1 Tax=Niabella drilacis (strain DSM 25811 / CCM 8410 / CCUG 62505 / LMG 26954 / E90) TaxID=1285928 RepID=A0A1G6HX72_NIADE|nr:NAD(P)-dependent oxidoreductase [Niabella drilacis]SDB98907.1 D-3-phosphoglycerate dehydrogenase [Niabella drilacis]
MTILITAPYHEAGRRELESRFGNVIYRVWKENGRAFNAAELDRLLDETRADALITEHDEITETVIRNHPQLKFIGVCRGTPSNVAVETAAELGIEVFHTPARNAQAVAELFVANVITFLRKTLPAMEWLKQRNWQKGAHASYLQFKGNELAGKTIGMVGFGAVGQRIAALVQAFPCVVKFYDPYQDAPGPAYEQISLEAIFETCDIVSIHLPVNPSTIGMIDEKLINRMKPGAIFVNTARASVVDRLALLQAIENNSIRGAILDVFDHEPPDATDYRLIDHPNVLATPHTAGATDEVEDHHVSILNEKLLNWAKGQPSNSLHLSNL